MDTIGEYCQAGRDIRISLFKMKVFIEQVFGMSVGDPLRIIVNLGFSDETDVIETTIIAVDATGISDGLELRTAIIAGVLDYSNNTQSYGITEADIIWSFPFSLPTAQAHVADAATNATNNSATNYNLVSGVLGLANGLNNANTAQNDLADKYNALATKFNTVLNTLEANGLLATS